MTTNIELLNINKHFYLNSKKRAHETNKKYNSKLVAYHFSSINEANISDNIKNMPYYFNHFAVVEDYDFINIAQLNETNIEKIDLNNDKKYLIFQYTSCKLIEFNDFLFNVNNPKLLILNSIESFLYILKSLIQLNENNICYFNLSAKNIVFNLDCGEKPVLQNFCHSLLVSKLNETYITNIINNIDDYTHKPLEIHILFYIIQNDIFTVSYSFIEEICDIFIEKNTVINIFSAKYKETYKSSCIEYLQKYINKPKSYIINDILQQHSKWDVYSISLLYLHIFGNISRVFFFKNNVINKLVLELLKNISPNPSKRSSLQNLLEQTTILLECENDWSFVNKVSPSLIPKLIYILEK